MSLLTINILGAGRAGQTIAHLLSEKKLVKIESILNRDLKHAQAAATHIGQGTPCDSLENVIPANIYLITTPDDEIASVCNSLTATHPIPADSIVLHCSGSLNADILENAKAKGCATASLHPLCSFSDPAVNMTSLEGIYCAYEGSKRAFSIVTPLFKALGAHVFNINSENKVLYHTASAMASNYLVTLTHAAQTCYQEAGIEKEVAEALTHSLMQNTLNNLKTACPQQALTGPLQRGDLKTIEAHLSALEAHPATLIELYKTLGLSTLKLTKHDESLKENLALLLKK